MSPAISLPWTPINRPQFDLMPEAVRELVIQAKNHQLTLAAKDGPFAGSIMSAPAWNQLFNGAYPMPTTQRGQTQLIEKLTAIVKRGEQLLLEASTPATAQLELIPRPELDKVTQALEEARRRLARGIEERLITVVGPTRSGKSCMIRMLQATQRIDWTYRARPSAKVSYRQFLEGLAKAVTLREIEKKDITQLEDTLLAKFSTTPCTLAIEELQRISRRALEFLKCLLNETQASLILFLKPKEWKHMRRTLNEDMQQFLGRNIATITLHITAEMVATLARKAWPHGGDTTQHRAIAQEAEKGGGMSCVRCILENSAKLARTGPVSATHIQSALALYRTGVPELTPQTTRTFGPAKKAA